MRRRFPSSIQRRQPPDSLHADLQHVHDGVTYVGTVASRGDSWRATARGGVELGDFVTALEARRSVLAHHRAKRGQS